MALKVGYNLVSINASADYNLLLKAVVESVKADQITGMALDALSEFVSICATNKLISGSIIQQLFDSIGFKAQQAALILAITYAKD